MLAFDLMASLPSILAVLVTTALVLSLLAHVAHATNHTAIADDLDAAKEAVDVLAALAQQVQGGKSPGEALAAIQASPEAQDLVKRALAFATKTPGPIIPPPSLNGTSAKLGAALLVVGLAFGATGCQTLEADVHAASAHLVTFIKAAKDHPELLEDAKAALAAAAATADPKDAPTLERALEHVNNGSLDRAISVLTVTADATAPASGGK